MNIYGPLSLVRRLLPVALVAGLVRCDEGIDNKESDQCRYRADDDFESWQSACVSRYEEVASLRSSYLGVRTGCMVTLTPENARHAYSHADHFLPPDISIEGIRTLVLNEESFHTCTWEANPSEEQADPLTCSVDIFWNHDPDTTTYWRQGSTTVTGGDVRHTELFVAPTPELVTAEACRVDDYYRFDYDRLP